MTMDYENENNRDYDGMLPFLTLLLLRGFSSSANLLSTFFILTRVEDGRDTYRRDERSMSPRGRREDSSPRRDRVRSASPGGRGGERYFVPLFLSSHARPTNFCRSVPPESRPDDRRPMDAVSTSSERGGERRGPSSSDGSQNPGTNLFVTGIHPRLTEDDVTRLFAKYGEVEKCQIMLDPHTKESRGFGFVKLATLDQADSAKERLQGEVFEGRTLSIEKARRSRPRTPTPGKYFGPPKRGMCQPVGICIFHHEMKPS